MPSRTPTGQPLTDPTVSRRALLLGLAGLVAAQAAGCGSGTPRPGPGTTTQPAVPALLTAPGVARLAAPPDAPVADATAGMVAFGHALARVAGTATSNFVASPVSIATAFAMARVGARGGTASQLDSVFGYPAAGRDGAYNAITRAIVTADVPPPPSAAARNPVVSVGNALFTAESLSVGADFLRTLASQYGAGARPVDFGSPATLRAINAWVKAQTAGRIDQLFSSLDPATLLVLANTVYLRADWDSDFTRYPLRDAPFTTAAGSRVVAKTMFQRGDLAYAAADGWQAVELPYAGADLAMTVMLPAPGRSPADMLAPATMAAVAGALSVTTVEVTMPAWNFGSGVDLSTVLPTMGLTAPFGAGADFGGIAPGVFISGAVHKANITVDRQGTEASAATGIAVAGAVPGERPVSFQADRPFAFAIVAGPRRVPLFVGHVADPTRS